MTDEPTRPAGVPVIIALAYTDDQPDHTRIGRVEHHPRHIARRMVDSGEARWVDDPRNADDRWPIQDGPGEPDDEVDNGPLLADTPRPLAAMSKSELRNIIPGGADLPESTTRLELLAYARTAQQPQAEPADMTEPADTTPDAQPQQ